MRQRVLGVVLLVLLATTGCGGSSSEPSGGETARNPQPSSTVPVTSPPTPSPSEVATSQPYASLPGALERCGPQPVDVALATFRPRVVRDRAVGRIPVVTAGRGRTVVVLLHETDGNGLCGWLPFAARILEDPSLSVVAVDLCGYGEADCRDGVEPADAASVGVDVAERDLDARRIVVVGASMGGSIALITSVLDDRVDAVADLSGPIEWPGMEAVDGGRALRVPALVAMAESESEEDVNGSRELVSQAPSGSSYYEPSSGHGYATLLDSDDQLGPMAAPLLEWIRG